MTTLSPDLAAAGAHLVGSVPLASSEAVFRSVADEIGDRLRRIPDGETGPRSDWIVWQLPVFTTQRQLEVVLLRISRHVPTGWPSSATRWTRCSGAGTRSAAAGRTSTACVRKKRSAI